MSTTIAVLVQSNNINRDGSSTYIYHAPVVAGITNLTVVKQGGKENNVLICP